MAINSAFATMRQEMEEYLESKIAGRKADAVHSILNAQNSIELGKQQYVESKLLESQHMDNSTLAIRDISQPILEASAKTKKNTLPFVIPDGLKNHKAMQVMSSIQIENAAYIYNPLDISTVLDSECTSSKILLKKQLLLFALNSLMFIPEDSEESAIIHDFLFLLEKS